jgi:hypothetical protein
VSEGGSDAADVFPERRVAFELRPERATKRELCGQEFRHGGFVTGIPETLVEACDEKRGAHCVSIHPDELEFLHLVFLCLQRSAIHFDEITQPQVRDPGDVEKAHQRGA